MNELDIEEAARQKIQQQQLDEEQAQENAAATAANLRPDHPLAFLQLQSSVSSQARSRTHAQVTTALKAKVRAKLEASLTAALQSNPEPHAALSFGAGESQTDQFEDTVVFLETVHTLKATSVAKLKSSTGMLVQRTNCRRLVRLLIFYFVCVIGSISRCHF